MSRVYIRIPAAQRFWAKVEKTDGCWIWRGASSNTGYGNFTVSEGHTVIAHRWAYEQTAGPIEPGKQLDHLCRNTLCVNPDHLEPVSPRVNILRSETYGARAVRSGQCKHGHAFTPENTYVRPDGTGRQCRECCRIRDARRGGKAA